MGLEQASSPNGKGNASWPTISTHFRGSRFFPWWVPYYILSAFVGVLPSSFSVRSRAIRAISVRSRAIHSLEFSPRAFQYVPVQFVQFQYVPVQFIRWSSPLELFSTFPCNCSSPCFPCFLPYSTPYTTPCAPPPPPPGGLSPPEVSFPRGLLHVPCVTRGLQCVESCAIPSNVNRVLP